jgi:hypothetical protein
MLPIVRLVVPAGQGALSLAGQEIHPGGLGAGTPDRAGWLGHHGGMAGEPGCDGRASRVLAAVLFRLAMSAVATAVAVELADRPAPRLPGRG